MLFSPHHHLSHFPICGPICHCHLHVRLSECSFISAGSVVLTTDDDVDRVDGLHECRFICVAFPLKNRVEVTLYLQCHKLDRIYARVQFLILGFRLQGLKTDSFQLRG